MSNKTTELRGKTAIVTGGTRGIGLAIAERLLEAGANVALCGTSEKSVQQAVAKLGGPEKVFGARTDVSRLEDVQSFVTQVQQRFGTVDILINNAGGYVPRHGRSESQ